MMDSAQDKQQCMKKNKEKNMKRETTIMQMKRILISKRTHSLLKRDEILLIIIINFPMGNICDIHDCKHKETGG